MPSPLSSPGSSSAATSDRDSGDKSDPLSRLRIQRAVAPRPSIIKRLLRLAFYVVLLAVMCVGGAVLAISQGWFNPSDWFTVPAAIQQRPEVRMATLTVESGRAADAIVVATGYLESRRQAKIGARAPGRIEVVHVEEGTRVTADQVLAVLEHADLDASLAAAQATLARSKAELAEHEVLIQQAEREFQRAERMQKTESITEAEYDEAHFKYEGAMARRISLQAATELAEARVREARQMQANMFIRAPFDGTVISKDAEVGESILPGGMGEASGRGSVVTVADLEHLEVDCDVKEDYISRIVAGQPAEVSVDAVPDRRYEGRVRKIIPMGDRARATIKVKVEIVAADERLFPDMSATVHFLPQADDSPPASTEPRVFCESEAIRAGESGSYVWVMDSDQRARRAPVKLGPQRDGKTEILEGLDGSEAVVIGPTDLREGQLVKQAP